MCQASSGKQVYIWFSKSNENMTTDSDIEGRVLKIIREHPEVEGNDVNLATNFRDDLKLDSLMIAEITIEIEDDFDIRFEDSLQARISSVSDLIQIIKSITFSPSR